MILCIISFFHQITKKLVNANAMVFLMQRLWEGHKFDIVLSSDCQYQSLSQFFPLIESRENIIVEFLFCYLSKWECKKTYLWYSPIYCSRILPDLRCWETWKCKKWSIAETWREKDYHPYSFCVFHCEAECMPGEPADNVDCFPFVFLL